MHEYMHDKKYIEYNKSNIYHARINRQNMTRAEQRIWFEILKKRPWWYKFLRQKMIGGFILDFYCSKLLLAIEIDGVTHNSPEEILYDKQRTHYLNKKWIKVIRYTNNDVYKRLDAVYENLINICEERKKSMKL